VGDEATRVHLEPKNSGAALLEAALERENMRQAWKRVKANKGSAGGDGRTIAETEEHLKTRWPQIKMPVLRVMIAKADGSQRQLGIPTVTDRVIQQELLQVLPWQHVLA